MATQDINPEGSFFSGTSGLVLPVPNKQFYPPEFQDKSQLHYYGSLFNSLEVNSSFYKVPKATTVQKWADDVPADFRFTYKIWQDITHQKNLFFKQDDVKHFMEVIDKAGTKKGCLLVQLPPGIRYSDSRQLENLLSTITLFDPRQSWKVAVEFRHPSWYREETADLLARYQMTMVVHDRKGSVSPVPEPVQDFVYVRFHGPEGDYKGSYTDQFLYEYAGYLKEWMVTGKDIYVYFNNTIGNAIHNLETLNRYMTP